jgi:hypothetical protein
MEVLRKVSIEVNEGEPYRIGDQITVRMKELGNFTATVQAIEDDSIVFMFDGIIAIHNHHNIQEWLDNDIFPLFPDTFNVTEITLPTCGQIFGENERGRDIFEPDTDEQFELMKRRGNRVCDYDGDWEWWWLKNHHKTYVSDYAGVGDGGVASYDYASNSYGVRPVFRIKK